MLYTARYSSPLGALSLSCDDAGLTGIYFDRPAAGPAAPNCPCLRETIRWLDRYFAGQDPGPLPPLHAQGTPFQRAVWALLREIPYGQTTTYGARAAHIAAQAGRARMSAQAVGGAVGRNPISILVPCHRVLGAGGNLTGYAGGLERKVRLLALEGVETEKLRWPR